MKLLLRSDFYLKYILSSQVGHPTFKASLAWLYRFKKKLKIVSRKITKVLSRSQIASLPNVSERVREFRRNFTGEMMEEGFTPDQIFNTDQSGFNLEELSHRTLAIQGSKLIQASINQSKSETHSYTIQPVISMDGKTMPRLLIVLQEKGGEFGPIVRQRLFHHPEVHITSTTSGKVSKLILKEWFAEVYFPFSPKHSVLVLDSFSTYQDRKEIDKEKPRNKTYRVSTVPPGLTGQCQPLDVNYFRSYKTFHRKISDYISFNRNEIELHARNTILKLQACTFFQFRSPRFHDFIKYAWYKAGLSDSFDRTVRFQDPIHFCFDVDSITKDCSVANCKQKCFIRCSWCTKFLCFKHFLEEPSVPNDYEFHHFHYCLNFVQN